MSNFVTFEVQDGVWVGDGYRKVSVQAGVYEHDVVRRSGGGTGVGVGIRSRHLL